MHRAWGCSRFPSFLEVFVVVGLKSGAGRAREGSVRGALARPGYDPQIGPPLQVHQVLSFSFYDLDTALLTIHLPLTLHLFITISRFYINPVVLLHLLPYDAAKHTYV